MLRSLGYGGLAIEEELKSGRLPALVATSSLELGIDMGAVSLMMTMLVGNGVITRPPRAAAMTVPAFPAVGAQWRGS